MSATASAVNAAGFPEFAQQVFAAAEKGDSQAIRLLAVQGADLQVRNADGFTPFAIATRNNHADTAMTILAAVEAQYLRGFADDDVSGDTETALKNAS